MSIEDGGFEAVANEKAQVGFDIFDELSGEVHVVGEGAEGDEG